MEGLAHRLRRRIEEEGPMRFRDWMEACLYTPDVGYYMRPGRKTGPASDADFATSPTLHPFLAQAVAKEIKTCWQDLGRPDPFPVIEFGGGEGDLARDAMAALSEAVPVTWTHIEKSPFHQERQAVEDDRVVWAEAMPEGDAFVVAHEFVDALPVHVLERQKGNWAEVVVRTEGEEFVEDLGYPRRRAVECAPKRAVPDGQRVTSMTEAKTWIGVVANRLQRGSVLIVDYGDRGKHLWVEERPDATVRGFRRHELADPLTRPGETDITASVDFTMLRDWAQAGGLDETLFVSQAEWLMQHGALEILAGAPKETVAEASAYLRLKQLVMPDAMGGAFKVARYDQGRSG